MLAWHPEALFLTHFGLKSNPAIHLQELMERLRWWARLVKDLMADEPNADVRRAKFARQVDVELRRTVSPAEVIRYGLAVGLEQSYNGLERYWTRSRARREIAPPTAADAGSFLPQRPHRIEARGARRGNPRREQAGGDDHEQACGIGHRIGDVHDLA